MLSAATFLAVRSSVVDQAPKNVMANIESRIVKGAGGWNACYHNRVYGPRTAAARRANPDSIISSMAYDVSNGPVRVSGFTWPKYWSLSLYQQNSSNYFVTNDSQLEQSEFNFVIAKEGDKQSVSGGTIVTSPTDKGIMLIRRFASREADMPAIIENQNAMYCGPA
ncbi:MAG: DUF1254 domain-containing protein [Hellea sp.]